MNRSGRSGFTLVELMVVVALVGLLVAIILPYFAGAFGVARATICAGHLEKIGQAYATRMAGVAVVPGAKVYGLAATGWQGALRTFMSDDASAFVCPEDPDPAPDPAAGVKGIYILIQGIGKIYLDQGGLNEWMWKMSGTQYQQYLAVAGEGKTCTYKSVYKGYVEDSDPYTWYFTFEDCMFSGGGDQDYYDVVPKVHYTDTTIDFTVMIRASACSFSLVQEEPTYKVLMPDMAKGTTASIPFFGGKSSYGMNSVSASIPLWCNKLLALDYDRTVAAGSVYDDNSNDRTDQLQNWDGYPDNPGGPPKFARHSRRCNVLFADGTVRLMGVGAVNPNSSDVRAQFWDPR
jgi:prepilin-type N-terminal cleavage/methylation domain-containing protein/prepilin-type processing-associated H-X9-DG protein